MSRAELVVACLIASLGCPPAPADPALDATLDRYFEAIGGRAVWAAGRGEYVLAKIADPRFPLPGSFEICWNWDRPQTADRLRVQGLTQTRVYTGEHGWTYKRPSGSAGTDPIEWDDARMTRGLQEWNGNFEVLTHRIAKGDERVTTRMGEGPWRSWIEVSVDQDVVAYLLLDASGAPKKFRRVFDEVSVVFGPLADRGEISFPAWGAFEDGEPFDLMVFEILDAPPVQAFRASAPDNPIYLHCE